MKVNPFQELNRKIFFNDIPKNHHFHYASNQIKSCKYTLITFLPKALYIQFLRVANIYFLAIAIISSISEVSSVGPATSIIPLVFVLGTSILREALEDWARYKNDKIINNQTTLAYRSTTLPNNCNHHVRSETPMSPGGFDFQQVKWKDLIVGDIVKIMNDEQIPADIIILESSDEHGLAYVETANLDGEKNLKLKQAKLEIKSRIQEVGLEGLTGAMLIDSPNPKIQQFKGVMEIDELSTIYLGYNNLILRGTHLKNTDYVIGVVAYTGHDTKLMRNQGGFRNKKSHIEKQLNKYIIGVFISQCILCLILTLLATFFNEKYEEYFESGKGPRLSYIFPQSYQTSTEIETQKKNGPFIEGVIAYASFMILLNTMIPISLIVSLEFAKYYQTCWIQYDELIKDGDQKCKVLNMLIHEDLAKIDYIFADKTGTLTTNEMKFMNCSIYGNVYSKEKLYKVSHTPKNQARQTQNDRYYNLFWLNISLCHDVIIDKKHETPKATKHNYQGSSPDEVELVGAAAQVNYIFHEKKGEIYTVVVNGDPRKFMLLTKIDFSSDRKRMSVVMRDLEADQLYLFSKGADSMIIRRLSPDNSLEVVDKTKEDLQTFSKEGLRTLAIAYKVLDEEFFMNWQRRYSEAQQEEFNVLSDTDPQIKIRQLEDELEKDLLLLGATALEDRLQDGVGETINDLHRADIKVWMLTGDKLETAENIGYATNLLASETKVFKIGTTDPDETLKLFQKIDEKIKLIKDKGHAPFSMADEVDNYTPVPNTATRKIASFALIIDGEAINSSFHNEKIKGIFVRLIPEFRTVICCRSTPNQKADVVKFVKKNLNKMTLAIGDGGNDVNMIQSADIGVGIFGKEGNQAAFASDYAISKFFFLWRLLFVHGRWSYMRAANFISFFFYKNIIFTFPQFWFAIYSGYSGQSIYEDLYLSNYNTVFTSVAPVYYAAQEQDVNPRENETIFKAMPKLYAEFRESSLFSPRKFLFWWATGVIHSITVFYITQLSLSGSVDSNGTTYELWEQSLTALSGVFITVFSIIIIGTNFYQVITFVCYVIFTLMMFFPAGTIIMDQLNSPAQYILGDILRTPRAWLTLILITTVCSMTVYIPKMYYSYFHPTLSDLLQRDRNRRWKKRDIEVYESRPKELTPEPPKFDFMASIMMDGWYKPENNVK